MSLELVQLVTGHRNVAVVLNHYFRPDREGFRQILTDSMPKRVGDGAGISVKEPGAGHSPNDLGEDEERRRCAVVAVVAIGVDLRHEMKTTRPSIDCA